LIHCERLTDYALAVSSLRKHWDAVSEDGGAFGVPDILNQAWVGIWEDQKYRGCVCFISITSVLYEIHLCLNRGPIVDFVRASLRWALDNTDFQKIVCNIPEFKRGAISTAVRCGFTHQGINTDSFRKHGALHALVQLGITRKQVEETCH
jgi:RimJ/RimL family protein N-acetyltransferase